MSGEEGGRGKMRIRPAGGETMGRLARCLVTLLILCVILLVTVFFAVRTNGGRDFVGSAIGKRFGMEVTLGRTRIGWPYVLVIEDLVSGEQAQDGEPLLAIPELRVGWAGGARLGVRVRRCELTLLRGRSGSWQPAAFSRLGDLQAGSVADISELCEGFRDRADLFIDDSAISWLDSRGNVVTRASGVSFAVTPMNTSERRMSHYRLRVYNVTAESGRSAHDVEREWLSTRERGYVEIHRSEKDASARMGDFWESVPSRGGNSRREER